MEFYGRLLLAQSQAGWAHKFLKVAALVLSGTLL